MSPIAFADFLAGSLLSLLLPAGLLIAVAIWFVWMLKRLPGGAAGPAAPPGITDTASDIVSPPVSAPRRDR